MIPAKRSRASLGAPALIITANARRSGRYQSSAPVCLFALSQHHRRANCARPTDKQMKGTKIDCLWRACLPNSRARPERETRPTRARDRENSQRRPFLFGRRVCVRMFADKDESERRPRLICASISRRRRRRRLASGSCEALSSRASGFSCAREFERRRENSQKLGQPLAAVGQLPARRSPLGAHFCHEQMRRLSRRLAFESLWRAESLIESARAAKAAPASSSPPRAVMDFVTCENNETARR